MNLGEEVDLEDYVGRPDKINNAEIAAICQEAGMQAVRKNRCTAAHHESEVLALPNLLTLSGAFSLSGSVLELLAVRYSPSYHRSNFLVL